MLYVKGITIHMMDTSTLPGGKLHNLNHFFLYSIQHYVIKFVSDFRQVGGFHRVLRFPSPIKLTITI